MQALAISVDGDLLASGSFREVKLWRRPSNVLFERAGSGNEVTAVAATSVPDRRVDRFVEANQHDSLCWNAGGGAAGATLGHTRSNHHGFSSDGTQLIPGSSDQSIRVWERAAGGALSE